MERPIGSASDILRGNDKNLRNVFPRDMRLSSQTMETTVTLGYGPVEFEIHALKDDDYKEEVLEILEFIDENEDKFSTIGIDMKSPEIEDSKTEETSLEVFTERDEEKEEKENDENEASTEREEQGPLGEIANRLKVRISRLEEFVYIDEKKESYPVIYPEEVGELGERKVDKQRVASLILLYLWHDFYDQERIKSTELKDALELSDISSDGMGNMYQGEGDRYFDRRGRGPSATVRLTPPGKRQARKHLKNLLDHSE